MCCSGLLSKWRFNYRYLIAYYELDGLELNKPFFPVLHLKCINSILSSYHSVELHQLMNHHYLGFDVSVYMLDSNRTVSTFLKICEGDVFYLN